MFIIIVDHIRKHRQRF